MLLLELLHDESHIGGRITPPPPLQRDSTRIGAPQSLSELLSLNRTSSISFRNQFLLSALLNTIPHSRPPLSTLLSPGWELFNSHRRSYDAFHTPHPTPVLAHLLWDKHSSIPSVLRSAWIGSPLFHSAFLNPPSFGAPQFHSTLLHPPFSALLSLNLTLFCFIPRFSNTICGTPPVHTTLPIWRSSFLLLVVPIYYRNVSYCLSYPHLGSLLANISLHLC